MAETQDYRRKLKNMLIKKSKRPTIPTHRIYSAIFRDGLNPQHHGNKSSASGKCTLSCFHQPCLCRDQDASPKNYMTNNSDKDDEEHVRRMLREAFAEVPCPDTFKEANACGPVIHEVCLKLRRDFYNYEPEEVQYMLPFVLEDLINSRTGDDIETEDAERLIMQLDPLRNDSELVRGNCIEQFANFTAEQSRAVCAWLRLARSWKDLALFTDWVDAAIRYWCYHHLEKQ